MAKDKHSKGTAQRQLPELHWDGSNYPSDKGNYPITYVSWYAAAAYAQWFGKRLPTDRNGRKLHAEVGRQRNIHGAIQ